MPKYYYEIMPHPSDRQWAGKTTLNQPGEMEATNHQTKAEDVPDEIDGKVLPAAELMRLVRALWRSRTR